METLKTQHPRIPKLLSVLERANNGYLLVSCISANMLRLFKVHADELAVHGVVITDKCIHNAQSWAIVKSAQAAQFEALKEQRNAQARKAALDAAGEYALCKLYDRAEAAQIND